MAGILHHLVLAQAELSGGEVMREGISIAVAGTVIVFFALILISLFIASLPRILHAVHRVWPEVGDGRHDDLPSENQLADDTDVLAAIGFVLHTEFQKQLAAESLTSAKR